MEIVNRRLKSGQDKAYLNALLDLAADAQFADQSSIGRVEAIINEVRDNLTASLAKITDDEENQVAAHAEDLQHKAHELSSL